jgi:hypothetical protein
MHSWSKIIVIVLFVSIITTDFAFAQKNPVIKDSTLLYRNIEDYSGKRKFTGFMYRLIFKPVAIISKKKEVGKKKYKKLIQKPYSTFEGKIIRHIDILTFDPFGYSIADTSIVPQLNFIIKANRIHIKTQRITIQNLLLIHKNQPFDSLLVKESERLIRNQSYVRDVSFFVVSTAKNADSVDVFIRELDNWSLVPKMFWSASHFTVKLGDNNFLGLGHESQNGFNQNYNTMNHSYYSTYFIPNIRNTYINTTIHYDKEELGNYTKSVSIDRPFFSPFAKWAAGINFTQHFHEDSIFASDSLLTSRRYRFNAQDYWAGNAIQIFKGNTENNRTTNFIFALRFLRIRFPEIPTPAVDLEHVFSDENFYLASMGISTRKYVQDKFIFKYGLTEDVPIGKVYNLTGGYQVKNNTRRLYLGARFSMGNYYPWGYLSSNYEYGSFFGASHAQQGIISVSVNYFTGLIEIGKWKLRQFAKPQITFGLNRYSSDSLTLNDGYGLDGFNSPALSGTNRLLFTFQTQSYSPWNLIGFRFGPCFIYSLGMLGDDVSGFKHSKIYSQIGLGVLLKNENLVNSRFQISIAFYPSIPGLGLNVLKLNSFRTSDFGFRDFEIGKPQEVIYQ